MNSDQVKKGLERAPQFPWSRHHCRFSFLFPAHGFGTFVPRDGVSAALKP